MATECTACNGFCGPVSTSPLCDRCHSLLYPAIGAPADTQLQRILRMLNRRESTLMQSSHPLGLQLSVTGQDATRGVISLRPGEKKTFSVRMKNVRKPVAEEAAGTAAGRPRGIVLEKCLVDGDNTELRLKLSDRLNFTAGTKLRLKYNTSTSVEVDAVCTSEVGCSHGIRLIVAYYRELELLGHGGEVRIRPSFLYWAEFNLILRVEAAETAGGATFTTAASLLNLPVEISLMIFRQLDGFNLANVAQTCTAWRDIVFNHFPDSYWDQLLREIFPVFQQSGQNTGPMDKFIALLHSCPCPKCIYKTHQDNHAKRLQWITSGEKARIKSEMRDQAENPRTEYQVAAVDESVGTYQGSFQGPPGSPYEGGQFLLSLKLPLDYPLSPPVVRFLTKIYHPNFSRHGDIGIDVLQQDCWAPSLTMKLIIKSIQSLLMDPYTNICMEPEIGRQYEAQREEFDKTARLWTQKFAMN